MEEVMQIGENITGEQLYDISDPRSEFESKVVDQAQIKQFKANLSEQGRQILELRYQGIGLQEIADQVGLKTHSAVSKRFAKITAALDASQSKQYSILGDKHIE